MRFSKWHALGNAYLLVERADLRDPLTPALVELLCDPRFGVGSDGLLEVVTAEGADVEISVWNPDGSTAEFSGNGARIAARWLARTTRRRTRRMRSKAAETSGRSSMRDMSGSSCGRGVSF